MKKIITLSLLFAVLSFVPSTSVRADENSPEVLKRLEEISKDQKLILESLDQIKSELQIVKVRASNN